MEALRLCNGGRPVGAVTRPLHGRSQFDTRCHEIPGLMTHPHLDAAGSANSPSETRALPSISLAQPAVSAARQGATRHLPSIEGSVVADRVYQLALLFFALCVPALLLIIFLEVGRAGWPALRTFGFDFSPRARGIP
jgi:hypothetical protein